MKAIITIIALLFMYIAFSTFFQNTVIVGDFGQLIGQTHFYLLGQIAYIDIFILLYPLYQFYKDETVRLNIDFYLGWILFFIFLTLLQSLVLSDTNIGSVGIKIITFLQPSIGILGLWIFTLMVLGLTIIFLLDEKVRFSKSNLDKGLANGSLLDDIRNFFEEMKNSFSSSSFEDFEEKTTKDTFHKIDIDDFSSQKEEISKKEMLLAQRKREELKAFILKEKSLEEDIVQKQEPMIKKPIKIVGESILVDKMKQEELIKNKNIQKAMTIKEEPKKEFIKKISEEKLLKSEDIAPVKNIKEKEFIDVIRDEKLPKKVENKIFEEDKSFINEIKEEKIITPFIKEIEEDTPLINQIMEEELAKKREILIPKEDNTPLVNKIMQEKLLKEKEVEKSIKIEEKLINSKNIELPFVGKEEIEIENPIEDTAPIIEKDLPKAEELFIVKKVESEKENKDEENLIHNSIVKELDENSKLMDLIEKGDAIQSNNFQLPPLDFLQKSPTVTKKVNEEEIDQKIEELLSKLQQFRVNGDVVRSYSGPLVTTFEFKPAANVKISKILGLQDDLAMALCAETIRIQAPIPGKDVVGIEIPNAEIDTIYLRDILEDKVFQESASTLTVALGKDIVGKPFFTDIRKLPHLLIAGTTGSGKSVGINAMILSLLYRNDPDNLKLMLIDPKMLEFAMYEDIPHLITPVITEPMKAIAALSNMVAEMERRYKLMAESRTKTIENYNEKVIKEQSAEKFPFIVVIIDELADLMMSGGKEAEISIARLAQKSRACGIHLIVATQRPSVDVVTGMIKANLPSRLSYRVGQRIDSKVILDTMGAESLLGRGDALFTPPGTTGLVRIHAPWNSEDEIDRVVNFLKAQRKPDYDESYLIAGGSSAMKEDDGEPDIILDSLYEDAKSIVLSDNKTSISYLQRKLQIGYNRSANIIEQLEAKGVLSAPNSKGNREIL